MLPGRLGNSAVGHCRDTWWQEYLVLGRCRDTVRLGTAGILCGWALQEYVAIEHCIQAGEDNIDLKI